MIVEQTPEVEPSTSFTHHINGTFCENSVRYELPSPLWGLILGNLRGQHGWGHRLKGGLPLGHARMPAWGRKTKEARAVVWDGMILRVTCVRCISLQPLHVDTPIDQDNL